MVAKCQPPTSMPIIISTSRSNLSRHYHHHHDRNHNIVLHPTLFPFNLLLLFLCLLLLMAQQKNNGADAFLLAHRKMLVPFASSRFGTFQTGANTNDAQVPSHLVGFLVVPNRHAVPTVSSEQIKLLDDSENVAHANQLDENDDDAAQLYVDEAETEKPTLKNVAEITDKLQNEDDGFSKMRMVKRMHHLSILRKIGSPGANPANRLFGPSRQRELKRRSWMIEY
ncbi:hypothetical protein niasHT_021639 [Heterodera trifolii]|uniref:Uncharacterized protein n=1 Tax=Heterodera trifolii TaxID=157864 RepID=A0ABD2JT48_9BILA